jgi:hypothetical protein
MDVNSGVEITKIFHLLWNLEADSPDYLYFSFLPNICPTRSMLALAFVCRKRKKN